MGESIRRIPARPTEVKLQATPTVRRTRGRDVADSSVHEWKVPVDGGKVILRCHETQGQGTLGVNICREQGSYTDIFDQSGTND